jgi:hypothetical protein
MRRAAKIDTTHAAIRDVFRDEFGFSWKDLAIVGEGFPDAILGCPPGVNILVECKTPGGKLSPKQEIFHKAWQGPIVVLESVEDARELGLNLLEQSGQLIKRPTGEPLQ